MAPLAPALASPLDTVAAILVVAAVWVVVCLVLVALVDLVVFWVAPPPGRAGGPRPAPSARVARRRASDRTSPAPEWLLLAEIDREEIEAEQRIDALARAFDQQVAQIVVNGRRSVDASRQRQGPADAVHS
jgi:hypothetical protein